MGSVFGLIVKQVVIAVGIAIGLGIAMAHLRSQSRKLASSIEPLLRARGPLTVPELISGLNLRGFLARGKVALDALVATGHVEVTPAPAGTPRLQRIHHIRYGWRGGADRSS